MPGKNIAEIIVNNRSIYVDKIFHYQIPNEMLSEVIIGKRVIVPFGSSNKRTEGFVIGLTGSSDAPDLKFINSIIDKEALFDEKMVPLVKWIRDEYICTYYDAIKAILPPGIGLKLQEWISINEGVTDSDIEKKTKNSELQKRVMEILSRGKEDIEYTELLSILGGGRVRQTVNSLLSKGLINISDKSYSQVKDKKIRMVSLDISTDEAEDFLCGLNGKARVQAKVIEMLMQNEAISATDIIAFTEGSYNTLNSLLKKGIIKYTDLVVERIVTTLRQPIKTDPFDPTDEQRDVINSINRHINTKKHVPILLRGLTGSGKTEVYLQTIDSVIKMKKQAIVLVPEISLTPQMVERFIGRFGARVAVLHSALSLGERYDQWKKIKDSEVDVVVGARSGVFAPFKNLGIIILDEEHETTYKSEISPRYNAREVALKRGENENAIVLLSSATPSIESYYKAVSGRYDLINMEKRYNNAPMPKVNIIDMRAELEHGNRSVFSNCLKSEIEYNIENNEQTILFINRRGHSTFVSCRSCGYVCTCPHCNISLIYHAFDNSLNCHYCGHRTRNVSVCPSCKSKYIKYFGTGTQKVEQELNKLFPNATVLRMDVDTTGKKHSHERILNTFSEQKINILIGTQMVSKGLDFPNVTLIGVLAADMSLNIDDFRSSERTFQLITQVSGRAGRGDIEGRAIIQTYQPDNYTLQLAKKHDYVTFYNNEIKIREQLDYPPFSKIISLLLAGPIERDVIDKINGIVDNIKEMVNVNMDLKPIIHEILGPVPAPIKRIKNKFRWRAFLKCDESNLNEVKGILKDVLYQHYKKNTDISLIVDINPVNMF